MQNQSNQAGQDRKTYIFPVCHSCSRTNIDSKHHCFHCGAILLVETSNLLYKEMCYCGKPTRGAPRCSACKRINVRLNEEKSYVLPAPVPPLAPAPAPNNSMRVVNGLAPSCLCGERNHFDRKTCMHCNKCLLATYGPIGCREFKDHVDLHMGNVCPSCQIVDKKENTRCGGCRQSLFYQYVNPVPQRMEYHWRCSCNRFNEQTHRHCKMCGLARWAR